MGALYHLKQKLVDFCNVIQENVSRTDTVPSSKVVYDLNESLANITAFNITTSHTANVSCFAIRHLRIITGRIDLTSNVGVWDSVFTVPSEHAANALYACILGTDTYKGWFEMAGTNVQSRMSMTSGTAIKFTLIYLSNTDVV